MSMSQFTKKTLRIQIIYTKGNDIQAKRNMIESWFESPDHWDYQ